MANPQRRLPALDMMRGIVMLLMAVDHSSDAFNRGRLFTDAVQFYHPGTPLPAAQFLLRWVTHLCAPTFVFLAGTGLAFSIEKERARGQSELFIDAYLLQRGLFIWACELWISYFVMPKGMFLFQVLYAIGTSYIGMIALRRLPTKLAVAVGLALIFGGEALVRVGAGPPEATPLLAALLVVGGHPGSLIVGYPTIHWLALMLLGWTWGRRLSTRPSSSQTTRELASCSLILLGAFLLVRGLNGYGNMALLRDDGSLVQWLHVSKYPPSISYDCLELGLMSAILALCFVVCERKTPAQDNVLMVLGQTPMFFYLLHFPLLIVSAHTLGVEHQLGIGAALLGALGVVLVLYPACRRYRAFKAMHPRSVLRFV